MKTIMESQRCQMIENNTSKPRDSDSERILDKISKVVNELSFTDDSLTLIEKMISLNVLLSTYDQPLSATFRDIDEKAQDPTYFIATYFDTKDIDQALWVYRIVRLLARYILLSDRFFEIGDDGYNLLAKKARSSINEFLLKGSDIQLQYSLDYSLKQFWIFWEFEQLIRCRTLRGCTFTYKEIRHFNLFKSSDALMVYARVLDAKLPSFNENVSLVLHYNQALLDLQDDWEDIEDDVLEDMPNVFVMAAITDVSYDRIKSSPHERIRNVVLDKLGSSHSSIIKLVDEYQASVRNICIPDNLVFLKSLSDHYADTLKGTISSSVDSQIRSDS
jgi:hypothetical protein